MGVGGHTRGVAPRDEICRDAVDAFSTVRSRLAASLVSEDPDEHLRFYDSIGAPFVGDGFARLVDGQPRSAPELGLSNWQGDRPLGRGAVLSGDSVFTIRHRARIGDPDLDR